MDDIFLLILLLSFIVSLFNLIRRKRRKSIAFLLIAIVSFIGFGVTHDKLKEATEKNAEEIIEVEKVSVEESKEITEPQEDVTVEEIHINPNVVSDAEYIHYTTEAERIISSMLLSPSTAEFPGAFFGAQHWNVYKSDGYIIIESWVDSQNAFGAVIRNDYQISVDLSTNEIVRIILGDDVYE